MSMCNYCGKEIDWIPVTEGPKQGKYQAVEPEPVLVLPGRGTELFLIAEGEWVRGKEAEDGGAQETEVCFRLHRCGRVRRG